MILPYALMEHSNLTEKQLESLVSYVKVVAGEMHYRDAAALRSEKSVTIGYYYRTVQQGRTQVREVDCNCSSCYCSRFSQGRRCSEIARIGWQGRCRGR